jgi:hypothetical protein
MSVRAEVAPLQNHSDSVRELVPAAEEQKSLLSIDPGWLK